MPFKCCVPGCRGNYSETDKVHVFSFPKDPILAKKWLASIPRDKFIPSINTKVCNLHFLKENIEWSTSAQDPRTGVIVTAPLKNPRLKPGSVPCIFPNCPGYCSKTAHFRKSKDEKLEALEQQQFYDTIQKSKQEYSQYLKSVTFNDYETFCTLFKPSKLPPNWSFVLKDESTLLFKLKSSPGPIITYAVVINNNLGVETFLYGQEIVLNSKEFKLKTPFVASCVDEIYRIVELIDNKDILSSNTTRSDKEISSSDNNKDSIASSQPNKEDGLFVKDVLDHVIQILGILNCDERHELQFVVEQVNLYTCSKERYRYSNNTMIVASIMHTISPHAYNFLRHSGCVTLPHPKTVQSLCNKLLTDPTIEERQSFCSYAKNIFKYLKEDEKHMILLMDEIHIKPYLDYKGGNIVGSAFNTTSLATTAYVFMIASVKSSFKEVIHISPLCNIDYKVLHQFLTTIIKELEKIGFRVFCVVSDNNAINSKAMSQFSPKKDLSIVYPHPYDTSRPLFYLFDTVHLLKCIRNNWLNSKPSQTLCFPDFNTGNQKVADFSAIKTLYYLEHDKLLKFGYSLSLKSLFPSNLERQNVKLVLKVFNSFVKEALTNFGSSIQGSAETADFLDIIITWWKIVNVKTPLKGKRLRDIYQEPIVSAKTVEDPKLEFLQHFLNWLQVWKTGSFSNTLSPQTHTAITHTTYCLLELTNYCFDELKLNYMLYGKFQTDLLEDRFGKYRQLAGGQYNISIRQVYETEKKLRIQSLLSLQSRCYGKISVTVFDDNIDTPNDVTDSLQTDSSIWSNIEIDTSDIDKVRDEMQVITYLAGYCCYVTLKKLKCEVCKNTLVLQDELVVEDKYSLIRNLSRGCLLYPQEEVINVVLYSYILFNKLLEENEEEFLNIYNKKSFLIKLFCKYVKDNDLFEHTSSICKIHPDDNLIYKILACTVNTLLKNYCGKTNDVLKKKSSTKRKLSTLQ
uniref:THAP-type domain-containing protein n=1 Tax=Clastoptera arizonana TaxID=38151 RepID=A0A1B6CRV3_9HEMI